MNRLSDELFPEVIPGFDPLALKEKIQEELLEDIEGMTREEIIEYFQLAGKRMDLRRKAYARRKAETAKEQGNVSE